MSKVREIPTGKRTPLYRFFEMLPAMISYGMIILLFVLSAISPILGSAYILLIVIITLVKAIGVAYRVVQGYNTVKKGIGVNWSKRLAELENPEESYDKLAGSKKHEYDYDTHLRNLCMMAAAEEGYFPKPSQVYHAVIVTMYNETLDVLAPTLDSIVKTTYPKDRMIVVIAYEERGGENAEKVANTLEKNYSKKFGGFILAKHPDGIPGEVVGKGGNITNAGKVLKKYVREKGLRYGDNWQQNGENGFLHGEMVCQIIWNLICTMRPHTLRNFASHSQPLDALVEMNFWSTRTIVEDGHQYWRSLFYFDGNYDVLAIRAPIYQDAVLSDTLLKTLKAQWIQLRRWDYGASDVAFVGEYMLSKDRTVRYLSLIPKFIRLLDGHVTLAAFAPIVAFGGWVPLLFNIESRDLLAHNLPVVVSYIQTVAMMSLFASIILSIKMLPPRPKKYRSTKKIIMVLQWIMSPVIAIVYTSFCAFYSQTRLLIGSYMEKFDVTEKVVKK